MRSVDIDKLVVEPCKNRPANDVVGQDSKILVWYSQAEFSEVKSAYVLVRINQSLPKRT
jgi:hypothetical protein